MKLKEKLRASHEEKNRKEYGRAYDFLNLPGEEELSSFAEIRNSLLQSIARTAKRGYSGTKTDVRNLSPGCRICAEGKWSCLFINGKCNAKCFYCPTSQDEVGIPATNALTFPQPGEYLEYIEKAGFKGVSISGGEPFLTFERSHEYITAIRKKFNSVYLWLYTNGTLVDEDKLKMLRDSGLNEIRFDIGATGYNLKYLQKAIGIIPVVTVEIPAIPEDLEKMKTLMKKLSDMGVEHLNLHQLRLTPHNINKLAHRPYTFLPGEKVTVIESEITALKLIKHGLDNNIPLPVNYCSFVYKNRYQGRGARTQAAKLIKPEYAGITENGYIRRLFLEGEAKNLQNTLEKFQQPGIPDKWYHYSEDEKRLYMHPAIMRETDNPSVQPGVSYEKANILSYKPPFGQSKAIELHTGREIYIVQQNMKTFRNLDSPEWQNLRKIAFQDTIKTQTKNSLPEEIHQYEFLPYGLQEYKHG
ncbi:MAG: radical SAM protein [Bacteroidales bacterium]